ncbi:hypothetical protein QBC40DRAFT_274517 [Triangularia verruculosa]|uniref:Uncharacterized protein n=1 Tax=Triangularia verruculosa TaxID=2587418 RepID=A0AAN7AXS8_9PEZI|nr:hypothetical protein QBC40DRAFT_274517 [Triangularia verruculosa]
MASSCRANLTVGEDFDGLCGWVEQPDYRGTFDIIFSCLVVVLTCTWTVLHLNLPAEDEGQMTIFIRKFRWSVLSIFAPEVVALFASCQWSSARDSVEEMRAAGVTNWTVVHGFYADMGGFILRSPDMPPFPINSRAIQYLVEKNYLTFPKIEERDIRDHSKADKFAKSLAIIQIGWMASQCAARVRESLLVTPLEMTTIAFTVCTIASYYFWFNKPFDVEKHTDLTITTTIREILLDAGPAARMPYEDTPMDFVQGSGISYGPGTWGRKNLFKSFGGLKTRPIRRIPNDYTPPPQSIRLACFGWALSVLHCAIHAGSWDFAFPTLAEQWVWRCSCVVLLIVSFLGGLLDVVTVKPGPDFTICLLGIWEKQTTNPESRFRRWALDLPTTVCAVSYFIARLMLLAQAAVALRSMPGSVYRTVEWTNYLPHM